MSYLSPFFDPVERLERSSRTSSSASDTCRRRWWCASWVSVALWCVIVIVSHGTIALTTVSAFSVSPRGVTRVALRRSTTTALWDGPSPSRNNNSNKNPAPPNEPPSLVLDREQIEHQQKSKQRVDNNSNTTERQGDIDPPPLTNPNMERFELKLAELKATDGKHLTQEMCDEVLGLCVAMNEWDRVLEVLDVMEKHHFQQERSTYRASLQACLEVANEKSALGIYKAMREQGLLSGGEESSAVDVQLVVATLCKSNKRQPGVYQKALDLLLQTAQEATEGDGDVVAVEAYGAVLFCITDWRQALQLLRRMESTEEPFHPKPDLTIYHSVLKTCIVASQMEQAVQVLMAMPKNGVTPTVYTYELVIVGLSKQSKWRKAMELLDGLEMDFNLTPTTAIYNAVISSLAKSGELGQAKNLLGKMRKRNVSRNTYTYNDVLSACAKNARWKDALSLLEMCNQEPGLKPDVISYTNAIRACGRGGKPKRALALFEEGKEKNIKLDAYLYTAIIDACGKGKMWRRALDLLDEMRENRIAPNEITYSVVIAACGNGGQWERALELLYQMREKRMRINAITYNAAINALAKGSRLSSKHSPKGVMSKEEGNPGVGLVEQQGGEYQLWMRALELLQQMKKDGIEPDGYSYSAAISTCGSCGRWKEALDLIKIMQKGGPKSRPNKIAYTAAIAACGRSGEWQHALELFGDMKQDGLQPDQVAYNALVSALKVGNQCDEVYEIWREMCGQVVPMKQTNGKSKFTARAAAPDVITVTDVIATLDRSPGKSNRKKIDLVFSEAVKRGIVLPSNSLDSLWEVDLSGMSLPVARAACHYILQRIVESVVIEKGGSDDDSQKVFDLTLITGVGRAQRQSNEQPVESGGDGSDISTSGLNVEDGIHHDSALSSSSVQAERSPAGGVNRRRNLGTTALREYVREILRDDFAPPIFSSVPQFAQGTVQVKSDMIQRWIYQQHASERK